MAGDVFANFFLGLQIEKALARIMLNMSFPGAVEALQAHQQPGNATFHKAEFHVGIFVEDAIKDDAAEGDHLAERMAQGMDRAHRDVKSSRPKFSWAPPWIADGAAEFVRLPRKSASSADRPDWLGCRSTAASRRTCQAL